MSEVEIDAGKLGDGKFEFAVQARAKADPSITDEDASRAGVSFKMSNNLPVGQTLVRGVNVRSGILTHQTLPLNLAGRGNAFNLVLSYSSSGSGEISTVGRELGPQPRYGPVHQQLRRGVGQRR
ncbi:hypothetical protein PEC18_03425 [Paucibacter sp. O1-1]|nr:hypothetical protein [Paucibacter sp. O1-1]MDA3824928.1 hypothetical protein [Paucibacter sp. O1-1]